MVPPACLYVSDRENTGQQQLRIPGTVLEL
jgi:hypothetical protein